MVFERPNSISIGQGFDSEIVCPCGAQQCCHEKKCGSLYAFKVPLSFWHKKVEISQM